jgi:dTMP kinase
MPTVVLEGADASGKDKQSDILASFLSPCLRISEPDPDLPTGKLLRQLLKTGEYDKAHAALFLADRLALQQSKVIPWQKDHPEGWVVSSRCFLSTLAYQQDQWDLTWLFDLHRHLLCKPNYILVLDLDPEVAAERMLQRNIHSECYERLPMQKRVRQRYRDLVDDPRVQALLAPQGKIILVDASGTIEETQQKIRSAINDKK